MILGEGHAVILYPEHEIILATSQKSLGPRSLLRPGDTFGEVALAMGIPRTASVRALTPAVVASCDRATFDEFVRPLYSD